MKKITELSENKKISVVIPAYNEQDNLSVMLERLQSVFGKLPQYDLEVIFVNDGSKDKTQYLLEKISAQDPAVRFIELSRNFGHQAALKAGLDFATGDAVISMDADMQHPPDLIPEMIGKWENGYEIVYTIRKYSDETSILKKITSDIFYKILSNLSDVEFERGTGADFRLMDRKAVEIIKAMHEDDLFLRGSVKWIGFRQTGIKFRALDRHSGKSKYNLAKMVKFAFSGITAFSAKPLHIAAYLGFFFSFFSLVFYSAYVIEAFINGTEISGWASLIMTVVFFGGLQLTMLGIIGIYLGKAFRQIKGRPNYIIRNKNF